MAGVPQNTDPQTLLLAIIGLIKEQSQVEQNILHTLSEMQVDQQHASEQIADMAVVLQKHEEILRGNGKEGLVSIVGKIAPIVVEHEHALKGSDSSAGIFNRVRTLEASAERISKPMWVILSAVLSSGVALLISHFLK